MDKKKVAVVAAGTAGHILPSYELIKKFVLEGYVVDWYNYGDSLEKSFELNGAQQYFLSAKNPRNIKRLFSLSYWKNVVNDLVFLYSSFKKNNYEFILITGGFVGFFPALIAFFHKIPIYIFEQNVVLGLANKLIAPIAKLVFFGLKPLQQNKKYIYTGQPLRSNIKEYNYKNKKKENHLLIIGGSLGADFFNHSLPQILIDSLGEKDWTITHICGKNYQSDFIKEFYELYGLSTSVIPYTDNIEKYYAKATKIISRAGALCLSELLFIRKHTLLVPIPNSPGDHQLKNAQSYADHPFITVCEQHKLTKALLSNFINLEKKSLSVDHNIHHQTPVNLIYENIINNLKAHNQRALNVDIPA